MNIGNPILLSIIIPVYNVENYLRQCLDSVLSQDLSEIEIICVNDGSTDNSKFILEEYYYKKSDIIVIDKKNGGLSSARNSGLKRATGKYIFFLDSDDYLLPDSVSIIKSCIDDSANDIVAFNSEIGPNKKYYYITTTFDLPVAGKQFYVDFKNNYTFYPPSPVWMYIYSKNFLANNNLLFREGIYHEDEHFTPRALYLAKTVILRDIPILFHRTNRNGSIMQSIKIKNLQDLLLICNDLFQFYTTANEGNAIFYAKIFELYLSIINKFIYNKYESQKNEVFSFQDYEIMNKCSITWEWNIYYFLFKHSTCAYKFYTSSKTNARIIKSINLIFRTCIYNSKSND